MSIFSAIKDKIFGMISKTTASASTSPSTGSAPADLANVAASGIDISALLDGKLNGRSLNWRESIVDLLKLLDMDSSLDARINLAKELGYTGSTDDTATMNVWLIKEVLKKLSENGGKLSLH